jgi:hypothetical protein
MKSQEGSNEMGDVKVGIVVQSILSDVVDVINHGMFDDENEIQNNKDRLMFVKYLIGFYSDMNTRIVPSDDYYGFSQVHSSFKSQI